MLPILTLSGLFGFWGKNNDFTLASYSYFVSKGRSKSSSYSKLHLQSERASISSSTFSQEILNRSAKYRYS